MWLERIAVSLRGPRLQPWARASLCLMHGWRGLCDDAVCRGGRVGLCVTAGWSGPRLLLECGPLCVSCTPRALHGTMTAPWRGVRSCHGIFQWPTQVYPACVGLPIACHPLAAPEPLQRLSCALATVSDTMSNLSAMSDRVTFEQAATHLGVSVRTVYRRVRSGELQTVNTDGRQWVVMPETSPPPIAPTVSDNATDTDRQMTDTVSQLLNRIADLEADRDRWRDTADRLTDTVSKLSDNVSELTRTVQGQAVMLAHAEGRVLAAEAVADMPPPAHVTVAPPRRSWTLRGLYRAWRGR